MSAPKPEDGPDRFKADLKKVRKYALWVGIALAVICKMLPPDYQAPCHTLASFCSGGFQ